MPKARRSFRETLAALARRNARAVEHRACTAAALALAYPNRAEAFRAVESAALRQLFRIIVEMPEAESGSAWPRGYVNVVNPETEHV